MRASSSWSTSARVSAHKTPGAPGMTAPGTVTGTGGVRRLTTSADETTGTDVVEAVGPPGGAVGDTVLDGTIVPSGAVGADWGPPPARMKVTVATTSATATPARTPTFRR